MCVCVCVCFGVGGGGGGRVERIAPKEYSQPQIYCWTYYYNDDLFRENVPG